MKARIGKCAVWASRLNLISRQKTTGISAKSLAFSILLERQKSMGRALINFMLDWRGRLTEMLPPALVNRGSLVGSGQLPKSTRVYFISLSAIIFSSDRRGSAY